MGVIDTNVFSIIYLLDMIKEGKTFINFGIRKLGCIEADESLTIPSITRTNDVGHGFSNRGIITKETTMLPFWRDEFLV